jgi:hypothetical protein
MVKGVIVGVIAWIISMLLLKGVTYIWKLELTIPQKLWTYAFITIASLAVILWYYFKVNPFTQGFKHILLYIKGYRFKHLSWPEIFIRYGGRDKFVGKNDFYIPWIEIFCNEERLKEEDFPAKIELDEKGDRKRYHLSDHLDPNIFEDVRAFMVQGKVWDQPTGRFIGFERRRDTAKSKVELHFEETRYFDYLVSNLYIDTFVPSLGTTIREHLEQNGSEDALNNPRSANHAGVTALLLCSDNKLILLWNRLDNATYPNQICASTSGTLEVGTDLDEGSNPSPPFEALRREMDEELHLPKGDLKELRLLAIARDMTRGGIPEFIFFAETGLSSEKVRGLFSRAYETNHVKPHEIKSIRQRGFITHDIQLHFSRDLNDPEKKKNRFNLPAMAAVYYYEKMIYPSLIERN